MTILAQRIHDALKRDSRMGLDAPEIATIDKVLSERNRILESDEGDISTFNRDTTGYRTRRDGSLSRYTKLNPK